MEESKSKSVTYEVRLTQKCDKKFKKDKKKMDSRLQNAIEDWIKMLAKNPKVGKEMERELDGFRSIRIEEFKFRIVYKINGKSVEIYAIGHRKNVYDLLQRSTYGC